MTQRKAQGSAGSPYPLQLRPGKRYLVDRSGAPFLIHGDSGWSIASRTTREEAEVYLADRERKGFNATLLMLLEQKYSGLANRYGHEPFTTPGDLTTPNEEYFAYVDWCVERAASHGILVFMVPAFLGYPSKSSASQEGWYQEVLAMGPERCREYGRFLGSRFGRHDNLIWVMGGDRNPGLVHDHIDAMVAGIKEHDTRHLFTAHVHPEHSPVVEYARGGWVDFNVTYTYNIIHRMLLADYSRQPVVPFLLLESTYEGEHNASPVQIRRQAYWAILCGGMGHFLGNLPLWGFYRRGETAPGTLFYDNETREAGSPCAGWEMELDSQGSRDMVHVKTLFTSRAWYDLVPDQEHAVVTRGLGEFRGLDYLAAALTADGSTLIAYMPTCRTITVDMGKLLGQSVVACWYNPRTGRPSAAGTFPTKGLWQLTPPGEGDWVLVADDAAKGLAAPGA